MVSELEQSATDMDPAVANVCSQLAGIWLALQRLRAEKPKHTMEDLRHYQNVCPATHPVSFQHLFCLFVHPEVHILNFATLTLNPEMRRHFPAAVVPWGAKERASR